MVVENGERWWQIDWEGIDPSTGKRWKPSWEPTRHVSSDLRMEYLNGVSESRARTIDIKIDSAPLENLIPFKISGVVMGDASIAATAQLEGATAFGHVHIIPLPELSLTAVSSHVLETLRKRFPEAMYHSQYKLKSRVTVQELHFDNPADIAELCDFERFQAKAGYKSLRFQVGRKSNQDAAMVGWMCFRIFDNRALLGLVSAQVEVHTVWINGLYGTCVGPHLIRGKLKEDAYFTKVVELAKALMPRTHPLVQKGWDKLPVGSDTLPNHIAVPDH